ncbi:hypothetical protein [Eubacterium callanderi]|uniref:hypothetical protein n=1 Tax=Eubacterium callanderi TaxID=53442 RepID=UPI003AB7C7D9
MGLYEELVNVFGEGYVISEFDSNKSYEAGTVWIDDCTGNTCGYIIQKIKEDTQ